MPLEKYLAAANTIVAKAVPTVSRVVPEKVIPGQRFQRVGPDKDKKDEKEPEKKEPPRRGPPVPFSLSYYEPATAVGKIPVPHDGKYQLILDLSANEKYVDGVLGETRADG